MNKLKFFITNFCPEFAKRMEVLNYYPMPKYTNPSIVYKIINTQINVQETVLREKYFKNKLENIYESIYDDLLTDEVIINNWRK